MPTAAATTTAHATTKKSSTTPLVEQAHALYETEERLRARLLHNPVTHSLARTADWADHQLFDHHPQQRYAVGALTGAFFGGLFVSMLQRRSSSK